MTDKQIIIDGVDVSGCDRLNIFPMRYGEPHEICLTSLEQWGGQEKYCKDRPNCYYKQLKAKEQECEELKSVRDSWISKCEQETKIKELYQDGLDQLKAENEELKNFHINLVGVNECEIRELARYKQALEKVRELIKNDYCFETESCEFCANIGNCLNKQILQICDEVKND